LHKKEDFSSFLIFFARALFYVPAKAAKRSDEIYSPDLFAALAGNLLQNEES